MGLLLVIFIYAIGLFIAYFVIKTAVRHGIDEANASHELHALIKEIRDELKRIKPEA